MEKWHLIFFDLSITFYTISTLIYLYHFVSKKRVSNLNIEYISLITAFVLQTSFIILRWIIIGHAPMTSMFEYLNIFSFFIVFSYLLMNKLFRLNVIGLIVNLLILSLMILSSFYSKEVVPLVPALNSYWLSLHVSFAALGEGLFVISFIASFLYLIKVSNDHLPSKLILEFLMFLMITALQLTLAILFLPKVGTIFSVSIGSLVYFLIIFHTKTLWTSRVERKLHAVNTKLLDQLSYQSIAFGYPIFTLGALVFAMIWAEQAWGSYWSWDPKETWAFISWLVYGLYLHLRLYIGWRERRTAWISVIGFFILLFTLFGVTYLLPGNHAYI